MEFGDEAEEQSGGGASGVLDGVVEFVDPEQELFVVGEVVTVLVERGEGVVDGLRLASPVVLARWVYLCRVVLGESAGQSVTVLDDDAETAAKRRSGAGKGEAGVLRKAIANTAAPPAAAGAAR